MALRRPSAEHRRARCATQPLVTMSGDSLNRGGAFHDINVGKRSFSLNLRHPRAKELLTRLLRDADG